uniref:hypothetical protein n=1 Tax=Paractinoplanes polyasparticus TaxID=2856853 RepID=UPI001C865599|nr:hypothetical protein [Actinoplanes polyasparticus]
MLVESDTSTQAEGLVTLTSADLAALWTSLTDNNQSFADRQGLQAFLEATRAGSSLPDAEGDFHFRPGGWEVNLHRAVAHSVIASALLTGVLASLGATQVPAAIAAAVVPLLFDFNKAKLTERQKVIHLELTRAAETLAESHTRDELYALLTPEMRQQVNKLDFVDFLEACKRAGLLDNADRPNEVILRPPNSERFRITLK